MYCDNKNLWCTVLFSKIEHFKCIVIVKIFGVLFLLSNYTINIMRNFIKEQVTFFYTEVHL